MRDEESSRSAETRWVTIAAIGVLGLLLSYNISGLVIEPTSASSFQSPPPATHRGGYMSFVGSLQNHQYDFRLYEALRRHYDGAELIGYDEDAISFGGYDELSRQFGRRTFAGFRTETVTAYDPMLSLDEAQELRDAAFEVLPATEYLPGAVVVAPKETSRSSVRVLVLRGPDGAYFYVPASMTPERFAGVADGN